MFHFHLIRQYFYKEHTKINLRIIHTHMHVCMYNLMLSKVQFETRVYFYLLPNHDVVLSLMDVVLYYRGTSRFSYLYIVQFI